MKEKTNFHNRFWQVERNGFSMYIDEVWGCVQGNKGSTLWREQPHRWRRKRKSTHRVKERNGPLEKGKFWQLAGDWREMVREKKNSARKERKSVSEKDWEKNEDGGLKNGEKDTIGKRKFWQPAGDWRKRKRENENSAKKIEETPLEKRKNLDSRWTKERLKKHSARKGKEGTIERIDNCTKGENERGDLKCMFFSVGGGVQGAAAPWKDNNRCNHTLKEKQGHFFWRWEGVAHQGNARTGAAALLRRSKTISSGYEKVQPHHGKTRTGATTPLRRSKTISSRDENVQSHHGKARTGATVPLRRSKIISSGDEKVQPHHGKTRKDVVAPLRRRARSFLEELHHWEDFRRSRSIERRKNFQPVAPFSKQGRRIHSVLRFPRHKRHHPHLERERTSSTASHFYLSCFALHLFSSTLPPRKKPYNTKHSSRWSFACSSRISRTHPGCFDSITTG